MFVLNDTPVHPDCFDRALVEVQSTLDLLDVARSYGADLREQSDGSHKCACWLRSTTGFDGSCSDEDATGAGGTVPTSMKLYATDVPGVMRWHCYSCKRGGCVVDLIAHAEGWPSNDGRRTSLRALRHASKLAGCEFILDDRAPDRRDVPTATVTTTKRTASPRQSVVVDPALAALLNSAAGQYWHTTLLGPDGAPGREYLQLRGVTDEQIGRFGLGFASTKWDGLRKHLEAVYASHCFAIAVTLGLLTVNSHSNVSDKQRARVICPYFDARGAVTGFAGRDVTNAQHAKWLNSNNVPGVWEKSSALWGVLQASERVGETHHVTICEGALDVLALDRLGIAAVAPVGTAFTRSHASVVSAMGADRVTLACDGDVAGRSAVHGWVSALVHDGIAIERIDVVDCEDGRDPGDSDPDDFVRRYSQPTAAAEFLRGLGLDIPRAPDSQRLVLERELETLADELDTLAAAPWSTHAEFTAQHERRNQIYARLATVRQQLA